MRAQATFIRERPRAAVLAAVLAAAAALAGADAARSGDTGPASEPSASSSPGFSNLAERVRPSVVVLEVKKPQGYGVLPQSLLLSSGCEDSDSFERLKRRYGQLFEPPPSLRSPPWPGVHPSAFRTVSGSGFFVGTRGHIMTSDHVVAGAEEITVTLHDGTRREARVAGRDPHTGLAVLKVDAGGAEYPGFAFGDEDGTRVGDRVFGVGYDGTVAAGILSARGDDFSDFLVNAPIYGSPPFPFPPGSPLFDARGKVVGVNTAFCPWPKSALHTVAVPASLAGPVAADLIGDGKVSRGWLGIRIWPLYRNPKDAWELLTMPEDASGGGLLVDGVQVVAVAPGGPAARAGIEEDDVVTAVDGSPVEDDIALARAIGDMTPGAEVVLTVYRRGSPIRVEVDLADSPGWWDEGGFIMRIET